MNNADDQGARSSAPASSIRTTSTASRFRKPHATPNRASRLLKASKIISIVGPGRFHDCRRILEVGCGSGIISSTLAEAASSGCAVDAVDVVDSRTITTGYRFSMTSGTALPFADATFDIVVSNHVIEHVGDEAAQIAHLREIKRVTTPDGIVYFAMPNKWRLLEPHYRLPLLSWFPAMVSDKYVRVTHSGEYYDCFPRSYHQLTRLFHEAGLAYSDETIDAVRETLKLEHPNHAITKILNSMCPDWLLRIGMPIVPTFVFILQHRPHKLAPSRQ